MLDVDLPAGTMLVFQKNTLCVDIEVMHNYDVSFPIYCRFYNKIKSQLHHLLERFTENVVLHIFKLNGTK